LWKNGTQESGLQRNILGILQPKKDRRQWEQSMPWSNLGKNTGGRQGPTKIQRLFNQKITEFFPLLSSYTTKRVPA
jgi:hypothetical protein